MSTYARDALEMTTVWLLLGTRYSSTGLPNPWPEGHIWPTKLFCVARKVFLRGRFPHGKAYLAFSGKQNVLNQNLLLFGYPEIRFDLRRRPFFLVFTYFWGQIPKILTEINTDLRRRPFFYLHLLFGTDTQNTGQSEHRFLYNKLAILWS